LGKLLTLHDTLKVQKRFQPLLYGWVQRIIGEFISSSSDEDFNVPIQS
jgi:hypothetical protein